MRERWVYVRPAHGRLRICVAALRPDGTGAVVTNVGKGVTNLGVEARADTLHSTAPVVLRNYALVDGDLAVRRLPETQAGAVVNGALRAAARSTISLRWKIPFSNEPVPDILLEPGWYAERDPGEYGA